MRQRVRVGLVVGLGVLFALWSWLTLDDHLPHWIDSSQHHVHLGAHSRAAQNFMAIAIDTQPFMLAIPLAILAWWAWTRRMRRIAWAIVISVLLAWPGATLLRITTGRHRPPSNLSWVHTQRGMSYPSGHMAMAWAAAILVVATVTTTRQTRARVMLWRVIAILSVVLIALDRWAMNAHWVSDLVGGWLWGAFSASFGLVVSGVRMMPDVSLAHFVPWLQTPAASTEKRVVAVIHNPTKVLDMSTFQRHVQWELRQRGWYDAIWLSTTRDDPGVAMAQQAIDAGVDMVIVAGGDGTVRVVCSAMANSGIPVAIVPAGTGNLLARNLGIPLDETAALRVAFGGVTDHIDLVRVEVDDQPPTHFAVMAGVGIDARIMAATDARLKATVGSAAYFIAAAREIAAPPMELSLQIDERKAVEQSAHMALLANVGVLQGGIQLVPDAHPNDGLVDIIVAAPHRLRDWASLTGEVLFRSRRFNDQVGEFQGRRTEIVLSEPTPYELDGDTGGNATRFVAEVAHNALAIRLPRALPQPTEQPAAPVARHAEVATAPDAGVPSV